MHFEAFQIHPENGCLECMHVLWFDTNLLFFFFKIRSFHWLKQTQDFRS